MYPLVVTLEEWHAFGPIIQGALDNLVAEKLQREGLPVDWLREIPFAHCSSPDFEELVQVISNRGVDTVMRAKATNPEYRKWEMYSYLNREFHEDVKNVRKLFSEVLDEISFEGSPGHVATVASF